jgi:hypothetical protein
MKTKLLIAAILITAASAFAQSTIQKGAFIMDATTPANTAVVQNAAPTAAQQALTVRPILTPVASGGLTTFHLVSAATTNATSVKASAGQLYGWYIYNSNAAARKVAFHNTAGTPTAGASVFMTITIPGSSAANVFTDFGIPFSTGIGITTTTGLADTDATAVALNDLTINLFYK